MAIETSIADVQRIRMKLYEIAICFSPGVANYTCQIIGKWHVAKNWQIPDLMIVSYSKPNIAFHSWNIKKQTFKMIIYFHNNFNFNTNSTR